MLKSSGQAGGRSNESLHMEPISSQAEQERDSEAVSGTTFQWHVPGRPATIFIDFDLVDRLSFEIMRGFGAVPKRGAEVGGILLGSAEVGERTVVRIEDFVAVACEYLRGPSYLLSEKDMQAFDEALERWRPAPDKRIYVVGYYRSNTREVLQLSPEDLDILETRLPGASAICLQVKPYATRASEATFFLREDGRFPTESRPAAFPFRRKEMGGGKPARRGPGPKSNGGETAPEAENGAPSAALEEPIVSAPLLTRNDEASPEVDPIDIDEAEPTTPPVKARTGWFWIPLSFIFLLLGVVLGFQIALTYRGQQNAAAPPDPYTLELTVAQFGDSLHLKWNSEAAAFRAAKRAVLHIQDGENAKDVELKAEDLSRGGALYRNSTQNVRFRLEIYPRDRTSVTESVELRTLETQK